MNSDSLSTPSTKKPKKPRKLSISQQIIVKHVARMEGNYNPADWGREGKICSALSKKYGAEFLLWTEPPEGYQISSLTFYYSVFGRNYLSDKLVEYKTQQGTPTKKTPEIQLSQTKIGEDVTITTKPKTLKEFLLYGKTLATTTRPKGPEESSSDTDGANADISRSE